jgi:hypothetical protein
MTLSALGIFSAAGAGGATGTYELIETYVLGSSQSSVVFSNLGTYSSTYKHLQIRGSVRSDRSGFNASIYAMRFNGDTGANYSWHSLRGTGSAGESEGVANASLMRVSFVPAAPSTANGFDALVVDIIDPYSTSKNKTAKSLAGIASSQNNISLMSGNFRSLSAITSVTFLDELSGSNNFVAGSRFSIYGIR